MESRGRLGAKSKLSVCHSAFFRYWKSQCTTPRSPQFPETLGGDFNRGIIRGERKGNRRSIHTMASRTWWRQPVFARSRRPLAAAGGRTQSGSRAETRAVRPFEFFILCGSRSESVKIVSVLDQTTDSDCIRRIGRPDRRSGTGSCSFLCVEWRARRPRTDFRF